MYQGLNYIGVGAAITALVVYIVYATKKTDSVVSGGVNGVGNANDIVVLLLGVLVFGNIATTAGGTIFGNVITTAEKNLKSAKDSLNKGLMAAAFINGATDDCSIWDGVYDDNVSNASLCNTMANCGNFDNKCLEVDAENVITTDLDLDDLDDNGVITVKCAAIVEEIKATSTKYKVLSNVRLYLIVTDPTNNKLTKMETFSSYPGVSIMRYEKEDTAYVVDRTLTYKYVLTFTTGASLDGIRIDIDNTADSQKFDQVPEKEHQD